MLNPTGRRSRWPVLGAILLWCALTTAALAAVDTSFDAGVEASRQGDFEQALAHFPEARRQGLDTPALFHNLGVAYYRLGRYPPAREAFLRAAETPRMRGLAYYNLGLIARAEGDETAAQDWFRKARRDARTRKLRYLAAAQLGEREDAAPRYTLYLESFAGYDSNPRLAEEDAAELSERDEEGDTVLGALAVGRHLLLGDWHQGLTVIGTGYADLHNDLDDQDIASASAGLGVHHTRGDWRHEYDLVANQLWLGGDTLERSLRAGVASRLRVSRHLEWELRLRAFYINGEHDNGYDYLDGWRYEMRARLRGHHGPWHWKTHYEFNHNDRDDLRTASSFFSMSPMRHEIGCSLERELIGEYSGEIQLGFRHSNYDGTEIRADEKRGNRSDNRLEFGLGLSRPLGNGWTARLEATHWDNASDCDGNACDRFDYDRTQTLVSVARPF